MKPILLPEDADIDLFKLCARMILQAYEMFDQWDKNRPDEDRFAWEKPETPNKELVYGDPLWATYRYSQQRRTHGPHTKTTTRWVDRRCPIGFTATTSNRFFVIFRGTETDYEWMKVNLKFLQKNCDFDRFSEGKAHAGFLKYYKTVRKTIAQRLAGIDTTGKQIIFSGHSLGGALSTLAAHDAAEESYAGATLYHINFAAPRVFNPKLARYYEELPLVTFRVVNIEDLVPTVPEPVFSGLIYQHIGTPLCFSAQYNKNAANHAMSTYLYALENPDAPQEP